MNHVDDQREQAAIHVEEANRRQKRAAKLGVMAAAVAWGGAFAVYALLKSMQPGGTTLNVVLLLWNVVMVTSPLIGFIVYRRLR